MANKVWLQHYLAAWNTRDGQRVAEWMADDATYEDVALGQTRTGRQAITAFVDGMTGFSTDYRFESVSEFSTDTNYVAEWELYGTHDGDGAGLPATGKPYRIRGVSVGTLRQGKIISNRDYWNMADFLVQIGALPPPA
jgi:steroid delta-isomerase-like uncharacterized protein